MITGRANTWFTIEEFAAMVGRAPKTVRNWAAEGRLMFDYLCGVPLVSLAMVESLIAGTAPSPSRAAQAAMRITGRQDRQGRRTVPERRQRRIAGESAGAAVLRSSEPAVGSSRP